MLRGRRWRGWLLTAALSGLLIPFAMGMARNDPGESHATSGVNPNGHRTMPTTHPELMAEIISQPVPAARFFLRLQDNQEPAASTPTSAAVAKEPFPFSHKHHADLKIDCTYCHAEAFTGTRAGLPPQAKCMACHAQVAKDTDEVKKLAALTKDTQIVPEKPVYKLPDFVMFSHARHKTAGVDCAMCHGDVWESDVVEPHLPMRMKACVDCHKAKQAPVTCTTCHEAFQQ